MENLDSLTFKDLFPYLSSLFGGLLTIFVGMVLKNQNKNYENQKEITEALTNQSVQLTRLTVLLENVIEDKIPALEKRLERLENKI
jgi:ubiquinone biosynthesis protein UbiJ